MKNEELQRKIRDIEYYSEFADSISERLSIGDKEPVRKITSLLIKYKQLLEARIDAEESRVQPLRIGRTALAREQEINELSLYDHFLSVGYSDNLARRFAMENEKSAFYYLEYLRDKYKLPDSFPREYNGRLRLR